MKLKKMFNKIALAAAMILPAACQTAPVLAAEERPKTGMMTSIMTNVYNSAQNVEKEVKKASYNKIAEAAKAQIGVYQDCTMLVTNALKAAGINFHGWPMEYASLGEWTNDPVPGDICIYNGHVALYIGNGKAIHGGWLGSNTVESTVECTNPFVGYIHVNL